MSNWIEVKKENIEIDGDDINIMLKPDDWGNNYVTVKIADVEAMIKAKRDIDMNEFLKQTKSKAQSKQ